MTEKTKQNSPIRPMIVGQFGPPTLSCIRSWGMQGFPVGMVCIASQKEPPPASKYLTDFAIVSPEKLYTLDGMEIITEFLMRFHATGITCVAESIACWLNDHRHMFPNEVAIWFPTNEAINDLVSKQRQIEIARKVGFNVLPTYLIDKNSENSNHILKNRFPLCLRPDDPATVSPAFKVHLVHSEQELIEYVRSKKKMDGPIVAQPFMHLPNLVIHGARTIDGASIGLQGFLVERKFEGVTLTIHPADLEKEFLEKCVRFTDYFDVTGNYHFEFLIDKDSHSIFFLELNNRLGGTTAKVFALGYDEPLLLLQAYGVVPIVEKLHASNQQPAASNQPLETSLQKQETSNQYLASSSHQPSTINYRLKNKIVSNRQALLKYFYYTIKGRLTLLDYPSEPKIVRILKTIYGLLKYRDDVFMLRDIKGSMALYFGNLKSKIPI